MTPAESRRKSGRKPRPASRYPGLQALTAGLQTVLGRDRRRSEVLTVLRREPNDYESTFPSEIVTCRLADGSTRRLFCKYSGGPGHYDQGLRGGVAYEAEVYRRVVQPSRTSTPRFYGTYGDRATGGIWLILECLDGSDWVNEATEPQAMALAAAWIGRFHAANAAQRAKAAIPRVRVYDADYYFGWARRAAEFSNRWQRFGWLASLCEDFGRCVEALMGAPRTIIHGEYYPKNILFLDGTVYPVDWESAAVAAGEIDLATLTEEWPAAETAEYEREYCKARWPGGAPTDFPRVLTAARLYLLLRWLADYPSWIGDEDSFAYFERLRSAGERLRLIGQRR